MRKVIAFLTVGFLMAYCQPVLSQGVSSDGYVEVSRDTIERVEPTKFGVCDSVVDPLRVVTNRFGRNWFVFATGGVHTFRGESSKLGGFDGTLSPDWGVGFGKWFTPGVGVKIEFIRANSRGYTIYQNTPYSYGEKAQTSDGVNYWKFKNKWWDLGGSVMFNLSRLFAGYEGYDSPKLMNQFMLNAGIGAVHHIIDGEDNEWSGHLELQYSRYLTRKKNVSLDLKLRGLFYQTNFDLEINSQFDCNLGLHAGLTFYLGKGYKNGWSRRTKFYQRDYSEKEIRVVERKEVDNPVTPATLTFYVFYPNNYSGRNDAPLVANATVNAIDYLAGGIFTQKKYAESVDVNSRIPSGASLNGLKVVDLPTERANKQFVVNSVPRGYELSDQPMSLSLKAKDMASFYDQTGYYYAPIYDGSHTWGYRIDDATLGQKLLSDDNYYETASYGLNACRGLTTVVENMKIESGEVLVSFADVYAAMNSNEGYISQYTDKQNVDFIKKVFEEGVITMIQAEGVATSQDNFTGENAAQVIKDRNEALSENRAKTVISWLKSNDKLNDVSSRIYLVNTLKGGVRTVNDSSTRGLNAKLNRCVKVRIHYMLK